jgi:hypothetical protein
LVGEVIATVGGVTIPMADKEMVAGEFVALLATATLPVTLPAAEGANVTFRGTDWLGVRVVPTERPVALNPVPETDTLETVTFEFPLFVSVALNELVFPTFTFPKLRLLGLAPSK